MEDEFNWVFLQGLNSAIVVPKEGSEVLSATLATTLRKAEIDEREFQDILNTISP